jgi:hypothetical protein
MISKYLSFNFIINIHAGHLYPNHLKMQDSARRERVSIKTLIEGNTMDGGGRAKQDARAENNHYPHAAP